MVQADPLAVHHFWWLAKGAQSIKQTENKKLHDCPRLVEFVMKPTKTKINKNQI